MSRYRPLGLELELTTDLAAVRAAAAAAFGGELGAPAAGEVAVRVQLAAARERSTKTAGSGGRSPVPRPRALVAGPWLLQASPMAALVADRRHAAATGFVTAGLAGAAPAFLRCHLLEPALYWAAAARGLLGVHGAGLVIGGRGLLLRGAGGAGKTTLAYAGARRGHRALAEDVVWIDPGAGRWRGLPWFFHLLADAERFFPELAGHGPRVERGGRLKLDIELEALHPGSTAASARPGAVVMIERGGSDEPELEPLGAAAARRTWDAGAAGDERTHPRYEVEVARLLAGPVYRLRSTTDLDAALALLTELAGGLP